MFNKMIRIFVSSTFCNFKEERDGLVAVFQELSEYCKAAGFSFQVLDLRWGISDEDGQNNRTLQICFDEIKRCQMLSPKPNFLILSGLYYGWIPLPFTITKYVWDKIADEISADSPLRNWYLQDENDIRRSYILRSRKGEVKNKTEWTKIETILKEELFPIIRRHFPDESDWFNIWGLSATEQEIYKGLFCHPENKENVFVLMRTKEPENCTKQENEEAAARAKALQEHIKKDMGSLEETNILIYQPGDEYTQKVKAFLKRIIQCRISEVQAQENALTPFQKEQRLLDEAVGQAERNYIEVNCNQNDFLNCCRDNRGRIILLTGTSGSGKSTLMRHVYYTRQGEFVLSCAEILPSCTSIAHALWFCLKQLQSKGILSVLEAEPDAEHCVTWFERQLAGFRSDTPKVILLDSVDQICDWNQIGGSLLGCRLPQNLTLIISCISEKSLNERDRGKDVFSYMLQPLMTQDSVIMLKQLLHNRGRRLGDEDLQFIQNGLPKDATPLYVQLLSRQLKNRRSFDSRPLVLPAGTRESISMHLREPNPNYAKLYSHTIGYLALAVDGMSEQELMILLEKDEEVIEETREYSHWEIKQDHFTLSVLWARIYYDLKDYFSEVDSNGVLLLRYHHDLVRQTVKNIVGKDNLMRLAKIMSDYFAAEPVYLGETKENVIVNMRKLREWIPVLRYRSDWNSISDVLSDPQYVDGYLRCGWYRELMQQFAELGQHKCLNEMHRKILALLQDKAMQFQLWGDSFLPAAAEVGIYAQGAIADMGWQYMLHYNAQSIKQRNIWKDRIPLSNAANVKIAVKCDGTLAILEGNVLKRYDLNLRSEIYPRCYIVMDKAFLYWKEDVLIVRDESCRVSFLDTGSELVRIGNETCPSLVDLYSDNINKIIRAGGFNERDYANYFGDTIFEYHSNGNLKSTELFYSDVEDIKCFCHGYLCAVLLNQHILHIIDLDQRLLLASYTVSNACCAYWNEQGTEVLIVFEQDKIQHFSYSYNNAVPLAKPQLSMKKHEKDYKRRAGRKGILETFQFTCPMNGKDTPVYANSVLGSRRPVFAAFSIKSDRLACYYYYLNQGVIRLFRLNDRELLAESTVDPVFWNDSIGRSIYFSEDGSALYLISRGKRHCWMMDSLKWKHNITWYENSELENVHNLQDKYFNSMKPWLPSERNGVAQYNKSIRSLLRKMILLLTAPIICSRQMERDKDMFLRQRMRQIPVVKSGGFWWIVDCHHSMIHVCDQDGCWICHEQLQEELFDFNVIDHTIYILPMDLSEVLQLDIVAV